MMQKRVEEIKQKLNNLEYSFQYILWYMDYV